MGERDHLIGLNRRGPDYAEDYAAWVAHQARLLELGSFEQLDLANLVDEVESLGRSDFNAFVSAIEIVMLHMLKWDHQPERRTVSWVGSIEEHRRRIARSLADNPSYKSRIDDALARAFEAAPARASAETNLPLSLFPDSNPYDWDSVTTREHSLAS